MTSQELQNHVLKYLAGKLTCAEFVGAVTDYLDGSLSFVDWLRFQMHLGMCLGCRIHLRQMKQTIRTLRRLPDEPIPPQVHDELLRRFRRWKTQAG
ncbi:MAG: anti-sigma factor family protein [Nitrospiraceae bacterium]